MLFCQTQFDAHTTTQFAAQSSLYFTCRFHIWLQAEIHRNNRLVGNKYIYIFDTHVSDYETNFSI